MTCSGMAFPVVRPVPLAPFGGSLPPLFVVNFTDSSSSDRWARTPDGTDL